MKFDLLIFVLILLYGCASLGTPGLKPRVVEDYYAPTGIEKYFLADLPNWANFDQRAGCYKNSNIRYFDVSALMKSYGLNYNKALQVQASYNEEFALFKESSVLHSPTLKEEELLFYKVSEKVSSRIIFFDPPTFKRINLVWLDEIIGNPVKEKKLKSFLNSKIMDEGVPLLLSFCLTRLEVEKKFPTLNAKMITAELLSAYDAQGNLNPGLTIDLGQFFGPDQKLYFYSQQNIFSADGIKGLFKIQNY